MLWRLGCAVLGLLALAGPTAARTAVDAPAVEAWADGYFGKALAHHAMTGAVVTVVQDHKVLLLKSYGYADYVRRTPLDPAATRLRICSNSKTFTATALLQLLDDRHIRDLSDPANRYLKRFQLPAPGGRQVTIFDLLTHRAGFGAAKFSEETLGGAPTPVPGPAYLKLLGGFSNPPGTVSSYSNSSVAAEGAILEDVSGEPYADYLARHIFGPLGMRSSSVHQAGARPAGLATPYAFFPDGSTELVSVFGKHPAFAPAGGVTTTGADMARYIMAQADEGSGPGPALLKPETFRRMHTQQVTNDPALAGFGLQYFTSTSHGERVAFHECSLPGFQTAQAIFPDSDAAAFVAVLSEPARAGPLDGVISHVMRTHLTPKPGFVLDEALSGGEAITAMRRHALHLPDDRPPLPPMGAQHDPRDYAGRYLTDRRPVGSMVGLTAASSGVKWIAVGGHGLKLGTRSYAEVAPDVFQAKSGARIVFRRDGAGRVQSYVNQSQSFTRIGATQDPVVAVKLLVAFAVLGLSGLAALAWPRSTVGERLGVAAALALAVAAVVPPLCALVGFQGPGGVRDISDYVGVGLTGRLWAAMAAYDLVAILAVGMAALSVLAWRGGWWGPGVRGVARRVHFSLVGAAGLALILVLTAWRLIGLAPL